jgi:hypothetical protein
MRRTAFVSFVASYVLAAGTAVSAQAAPATAMDGRWHFTVAPYFWFSGLDGTVSMKGIAEVPVNASFSDIWDNFDIGMLGRFEGRKDRWGFGVDLVYLNLGAGVAEGRPILGQLGLEADLRQLVAEGFGAYRVVWSERGGYLDVIAGLRYVGTKAGLNGQRLDGADFESTKQKIDWVDPLAGARFRIPFGSRVGLTGRTDIAGLGSKLSWNVLASLDVALSRHWTLGAGYRHFDVEYDEESGGERQLYDVAYSGPHAFVAYSW